ncbi:beta-L-arabinofuranosidase domain-containing protein [Opitutus sp. ER46]|uniref:beta-L-arabinofuranosidase domain-containing protein n=1 Tax=Opitutus sp. ER46 TaxID=2161864 RepID=UPI000D309960|nr:beta-L-arabinofuranosidase domain-containing protein [Opitutus sp. ER46]PTX96612.1 glycosyl hydrolase [Opitutus sp. ER46]
MKLRSVLLLSLLGLVAVAPVFAADAKPLRHARFAELPLTAIHPQGWLAESLQRQVAGMSGHREVHGYPFDTCLWGGEIPRIGTHGQDWWRYEQTAYLVDGLTRLAHLTRDPSLLKLADANISYVLQHPHADGRLGPVISGTKSEWPMAVFFRAAYGQWLGTQDPAIVEGFARHYRATTVEQLSKGHRHICNLEGVLQCYEWTGDQSLLEKAEAAYALWPKYAREHEVPINRLESDDRIVTHGVTWSEQMKLPTLLYIQTGNPRYLTAAQNAVRKTIRDHLQVDGVPSSNEYLSSQDPAQSHETCVVTDYTWSLGYLLMATGDATYADMIERAVFNAGFGSFSKDFRALQYFSSPNQFTAGRGYDHNEYKHGGTWNSYQPRHETECCAGNVHRLLPNFAGRQWLRDGAGLAAAFYAPSQIDFGVGDRTVRITEETKYPFGDTVVFTFQADKAVDLPLAVRIPGWCEAPEATFNGQPVTVPLVRATFVRLPLTVRTGDTLRLRFPMPLKLHRRGHELSLERGPLVFSYAISEERVVRSEDTKYPDFPALDLTPAGPWAYALDITEANFRERVKVVENAEAKPGYPFDPGASPITLQVPARRVRNWTLDEGRFTSAIPVACDLAPETETITLVPLGSTRLRVTCFPEAVERYRLPFKDWQVSPIYAAPGIPEELAKSPAMAAERWRLALSHPEAPELGGAMAWRAVDNVTNGRIDLAQLLGQTRGLVYVRATIHAKQAGPATLAVHVKDCGAVWLNDQPVLTIPGPHKLSEQPTLVPVSLRAGDNEVMVKVAPLPKYQQHLDGWRLQLECVQ